MRAKQKRHGSIKILGTQVFTRDGNRKQGSFLFTPNRNLGSSQSSKFQDASNFKYRVMQSILTLKTFAAVK